ncbi:MAG: glycine zipper domain-containing protein [Planctomycetota bacterium]
MSFQRCVAATLAALLAGLSTSSDVQAQTGRQRGATWGGITGAIAGAIIGENNDEAGAGAAIGGVLGAVAGGVLGDANDQDLARRQYYYRQQQAKRAYPAAPVATPVPVATGAVTITDVVNLSRSGVGDGVILNQIQTRGVQRTPVVGDIISMHQQGVSETVITAMQVAPVGGPAVVPSAPVVTQPPVIVEHHQVIQPRPIYVQPRRVYQARPRYHYHFGF